jgi:hypothetical protein
VKIIEIQALENGGHRNQTSDFLTTIPNGWAQIPDDMPIPDTFPFVNIEVAEETRYNEVKHYNEETEEYETEQIPYTVTVVTSMTEGVVPEPVPMPEREPTTDEILDTLLGVNEDE